MHTGFVGNADATASSTAAFGSAGAEVGTETTTALRCGWGVWQKWQGPGSLLPSLLLVHWPLIQAMSDDAMACFYGNCDITNNSSSVPHLLFFLHASTMN
jgi:hypothetical protein